MGQTPNVGLLASISRGRLVVPPRILIYGPAGVGKTSLAADAPEALFFCSEDGTSELDAARLKPMSWREFISRLEELLEIEHGFKTLVIDTADWLEPICWEYVCQQGNKGHIEDFGFGRGYVAAAEEWRRALKLLDRLRDERGMTIVIIAHSRIARFANPEGEDYDRYLLKMNEKASALLREWSDVVLFCQHETVTRTTKQRTRGLDSGARVMHTQRSAAFDAKNRYGLPPIMPMAWPELEAGIRARNPAASRAMIAAAMPKLSEAVRAELEAAITRAGDDPLKLAKLANWAKAKIQIETTEAT